MRLAGCAADLCTLPEFLRLTAGLSMSVENYRAGCLAVKNKAKYLPKACQGSSSSCGKSQVRNPSISDPFL